MIDYSQKHFFKMQKSNVVVLIYALRCITISRSYFNNKKNVCSYSTQNHLFYHSKKTDEKENRTFPILKRTVSILVYSMFSCLNLSVFPSTHSYIDPFYVLHNKMATLAFPNLILYYKAKVHTSQYVFQQSVSCMYFILFIFRCAQSELFNRYFELMHGLSTVKVVRSIAGGTIMEERRNCKKFFKIANFGSLS